MVPPFGRDTAGSAGRRGCGAGVLEGGTVVPRFAGRARPGAGGGAGVLEGGAVVPPFGVTPRVRRVAGDVGLGCLRVVPWCPGSLAVPGLGTRWGRGA